jgi:hypothetical protein
MHLADWVGHLRIPVDVKVPDCRREKLKTAMMFYARFLAEDPINGSTFDNLVLDALTNLLKPPETNCE